MKIVWCIGSERPPGQDGFRMMGGVGTAPPPADAQPVHRVEDTRLHFCRTRVSAASV